MNIIINKNADDDQFFKSLYKIDELYKQIKDLIIEEEGHYYTYEYFEIYDTFEENNFFENPYLFKILKKLNLEGKYIFINGGFDIIISDLDITYDGLTLNNYLERERIDLEFTISLDNKFLVIQKLISEYINEILNAYKNIMHSKNKDISQEIKDKINESMEDIYEYYTFISKR